MAFGISQDQNISPVAVQLGRGKSRKHCEIKIMGSEQNDIICGRDEAIGHSWEAPV